MAKQNGKSPRTASPASAPPERAQFVGYVNISLTEKDKPDFEGWSRETDIVADHYLASLEQGYQYTVKADLSHDAYMCSVSQWTVGRPDAGLIYTARSDTPDAALLKAIYVVARKLAFNLGNGYVKQFPYDAF